MRWEEGEEGTIVVSVTLVVVLVVVVEEMVGVSTMEEDLSSMGVLGEVCDGRHSDTQAFSFYKYSIPSLRFRSTLTLRQRFTR